MGDGRRGRDEPKRAPAIGWIPNARELFSRLMVGPQHAKPSIFPSLLVAKVPKWTMTDDYLRLLASFEVALPLMRLCTHSVLKKTTLAQKILSLSEGTIGEISALLSRVALDAIECGSEQITNAFLDGADIRHHVNGGVSLQW